MSTHRDDIVATIDRWLEPGRFQDYCPNGLQVQGRAMVGKLVSGVTASQALIDAAVAAGADMLLVHHGYFWKGEDARVVGMKRERLKTLILNDVNLVAYHLPLDDHPELGNNSQLARVLGIEQAAPLDGLVWSGRLPEPLAPMELSQLLHDRLKRQPLHVGQGVARIERVAWCTGAAQGYIQKAIEAGMDAFISGEVSEPTVHIARECGIHYYGAGHHATERYGVQALGERLAAEFGLEHLFIDIDNPV
ncbi:MAG: Nif3-like dinuclear metal center hexameric protein [Marinobacter sp.]|nr:Nif3-like dinuclear metal center hexameric protein [Marinobacter sp.]